MSRNDTIYTLQQEIKVPKIVTDKADKTLEQIRKDADMKEPQQFMRHIPDGAED